MTQGLAGPAIAAGLLAVLLAVPAATAIPGDGGPFLDRDADGTIQGEDYFVSEEGCEIGETAYPKFAGGTRIVLIPAAHCEIVYGAATQSLTPETIRVGQPHNFEKICYEVTLSRNHILVATYSFCFDEPGVYKTVEPDQAFRSFLPVQDSLSVTYEITESTGPSWSNTFANLWLDWIDTSPPDGT